MGAAKDLHTVPCWEPDASLLRISLQIGCNRVRSGNFGPWRVVPQEDLAFPGVRRPSGLDVGGKGVRDLRSQGNLDANAGLGTHNRERVSVPINVIEAQRKDGGGTPPITCRCDEDGEVPLAEWSRSIDGSKDPLERRPG